MRLNRTPESRIQKSENGGKQHNENFTLYYFSHNKLLGLFCIGLGFHETAHLTLYSNILPARRSQAQSTVPQLSGSDAPHSWPLQPSFFLKTSYACSLPCA